ncbi:MAG: hypothetical protein R2710_23310 [Acidimicrobiales bacterium]
MTLAEFQLEDRFRIDEGDVAMSGVQALLRVLLDQLRADRRDGLDNAAMIVSGYRGSPLGGIDSLMLGNADQLADNNITFIPGLNEDLGATLIWGSQVANKQFDGKHDGVDLGMWYGKAPGLDRSGDALRHANTCGVDPKGGVLLVAGDDPASKSSTLASVESEYMLQHLQTPILYPGTVQEVADYGRIGYELSGFSRVVGGAEDRHECCRRLFDHQGRAGSGPHATPRVLVGRHPWAPRSSQIDSRSGRRQFGPSSRSTMLGWSRSSGSRARSDSSRCRPSRRRAGRLIAAGSMYGDLREALDRMGLDEPTLHRLGVRVLKPALVWPLEPASFGRFAEAGSTSSCSSRRSDRSSRARSARSSMGTPTRPPITAKRNHPASSVRAATEDLVAR